MNCEGLLIYDLIFVDDLWKFFCAKEDENIHRDYEWNLKFSSIKALLHVT